MHGASFLIYQYPDGKPRASSLLKEMCCNLPLFWSYTCVCACVCACACVCVCMHVCVYMFVYVSWCSKKTYVNRRKLSVISSNNFVCVRKGGWGGQGEKEKETETTMRLNFKYHEYYTK